MKEKFVNSSINFINKYQECDHLKLIKLKYGLEGIYNLFVKLTVVIIIAIITKTLNETLLFLLFYAGIRTFSFGWHAKNSLGCWITTLIFYNLIPLLTKSINIPNFIGYLTLLLSGISMILWAPADTPKKPLIRKEQRRKCKIISVFIVILYSIIYFTISNNILKNCLIYALIVQILCVNPITYKITKTTFNNYKYYKKNKNTV